MRNKYVDNQSKDVLIGWPSICKHMGVGVSAARRWERVHALPIARLPDGRTCTTRQLLQAWILARSRAHRDAMGWSEADSQPDQDTDATQPHTDQD